MCTNLDIHEMYLRLKLTCTFHQAPMNVSFGHDKELKIGRYGTSIKYLIGMASNHLSCDMDSRRYQGRIFQKI